MEIVSYADKYKNQAIALILYLQNFESCVDLSLDEQPDLNDVHAHYLQDGGGFWLALNDDGMLVGTLGLMRKDNGCGVLKKFFVFAEYRGRECGVSEKLYSCLLARAGECGMKSIILDSPSACTRAHSFYERKGFSRITRDRLPIEYEFADRDSFLFMKKL